LSLARLFKAGATNAYPISVAERRLIPIIGINRRCGDSNNFVTALPALKSRANLTWSLRDREDRQMDKVQLSTALTKFFYPDQYRER